MLPLSRSSVFVFVLVFVVTFFFYDIQFNRIESHDLKFRSTFLTTHDFALVRVQIHMDISIAFRASSGRHSLILPALSEGRDSPAVGRAPLPCKQPNQSTRERWNLQPSFSEIVGPNLDIFMPKLCAANLSLFASFFASLRSCVRSPRERPTRLLKN